MRWKNDKKQHWIENEELVQLAANDTKLAAANNNKIAEFYAKASQNATKIVENQLTDIGGHSQVVRIVDK